MSTRSRFEAVIFDLFITLTDYYPDLVRGQVGLACGTKGWVTGPEARAD